MHTPSTQSGGAVPTQLAMHEAHRARLPRLWSGKTPDAKPPRPRPVSPFVRELLAKTKAEREAAVQRAQNFNAGIVDADDAPASANGWPAYTPPLFFDHCDGLPFQPPPPTWRTIARQVCTKHDVRLEDVLSPRRDHRTVVARHEAFWRCRNETMLSLPQIGKRFGGRDHTTVLHGIKQHEKRKREPAQQ